MTTNIMYHRLSNPMVWDWVITKHDILSLKLEANFIIHGSWPNKGVLVTSYGHTMENWD